MSELDKNINERPRTAMKRMPSTRQILGLAFGIFMVFVYVGMGILLMLNFFQWYGSIAWTRWIVGVVLVIYGFYRGWREYKRFTVPDEE